MDAKVHCTVVAQFASLAERLKDRAAFGYFLILMALVTNCSQKTGNLLLNHTSDVT